MKALQRDELSGACELPDENMTIADGLASSLDKVPEMHQIDGSSDMSSGPDVFDDIGQSPAAAELPPGYFMARRGLVWRDQSDPEKPELWLAGNFDILAETRDGDGNFWGILIAWKDHDGRDHQHALPRAALAGDGAEARRILMDGGLFISPGRKQRDLFNAFLGSVQSPRRVTATSRIGWNGSAFVLPDRSYGYGDGEGLLLQGTSATPHAFRQRGTLTEWQENVAARAAGNNRLVLALSAAFAGPLLGVCNVEGGGVHFRGPSSTGKSTALLIAASVWGGGEPGGYVRSWRATANGLEGVASMHSDALLCLDEMSQLAAREAGEVAYMLANGAGKSRSGRDGSLRHQSQWRVLFLSSGEIGLADKVAEDGRGRRVAAGQKVRIVDVPADAGAGMGVFEDLHGAPSPAAFAGDLKAAAKSFYGTPSRAFLDAIVGDLEDVGSAVAEHVHRFVKIEVPQNADGQVQRVAERFGMIAAGAELAVEVGILPWRRGEAFDAAARCFQDWLAARGGFEPAEIRDGIAQVRDFLLSHGMSRFAPAWDAEDGRQLPIRDSAGFRRMDGNGWDFFVTTAAWKQDVCVGFDSSSIAAALIERGLLLPDEDGVHRAKSLQVPGYGKRRLYHLRAEILEDDGSD